MTPALSGLEVSARRFRFAGGTSDGFMLELRAHAATILSDPARLRRGRWVLWAKATLWVAIFVLSYGLLLTDPVNGWLSLALAFSVGMAALMLAISVGHDAAHGTAFASA